MPFWRTVAGLSDDLHAKLAAVGLVAPRGSVQLAGFIDDYIQSRHDVKERTTFLYRETRNNLCEFFGESKPLRDVTLGDADAFRLYLIGKGLSEKTTVRRRLGRAKQFFTAAVRHRLIDANPFADQKCAVGNNTAKMCFIGRAESEAVLAACPDHEWRLIFALARYGGLRTPAETIGLRWSDIDWEYERMIVKSPKTEHIEGKGSRLVPIFPELRPHLADAFDQAEEGTEFVITRYRDSGVNLRTQMLKIIETAGLQPWKKLFQNLRATRETELAESFPMHVVCSWIGNSQSVAAKHYLQVTDDHFKQAVSPESAGAKGGARLVQKPAQHTSAHGGIPSAETQQTPAGTGVVQEHAELCGAAQATPMPPLGLEPRTY